MSVVVISRVELCAACGEFGVEQPGGGRVLEANDLCSRCWKWCERGGFIQEAIAPDSELAERVRAASPWWARSNAECDAGGVCPCSWVERWERLARCERCGGREGPRVASVEVRFEAMESSDG